MHQVSVITVSYNGSRLLPRLLESLRRLTYPSIETVVVDNGSTDGSADLVRQRFPWVRLVEAPGNLGFAGGNNLGIRETRAPFVALINNDAFPEPEWIDRLLAAAEADDTVAAVTSKIVFDRRYVAVSLRPADEPAPGEADGAGRILVGRRSGFEGSSYEKLLFGRGFGAWAASGDLVGRVVDQPAQLLVPLPELAAGATARLRLELALTAGDRPRALAVSPPGSSEVILEASREPAHHRIEMATGPLETAAFDVVNNVGTVLDRHGDPADRGINEPDRGQYDEAGEVPAMCGAAVLLRRSALEEIGLFDRDFFMYYEDTDLSWRLRAAGWRIRYEPTARVRHLHAASSVEWSPTFNFYTARNRVLTLAKNASPGRFLRGYGRELGVLARLAGRALRDDGGRRELATRLQVHRSLLHQIPRAFGKRWGWLEH